MIIKAIVEAPGGTKYIMEDGSMWFRDDRANWQITRPNLKEIQEEFDNLEFKDGKLCSSLIRKKSMEFKFVECKECAAKPGMPTLCDSCLNNRNVIDDLKSRRADVLDALESMYEQYCGDGHHFMSAEESACAVLAEERGWKFDPAGRYIPDLA